MEYITLDDLHDDILIFTADDVAESNKFIVDTALKYGVAENEILVPCTYSIKRLGVVFACYNRCLMSVGRDGTAVFDGSRNADIFSVKLEYYRAELKRLTESLSKADFCGSKSTNGHGSILLWRS